MCILSNFRTCRSILLIAALGIFASPSAANARDGAPYAEFNGGFLWLNDIHFGNPGFGLDDFAAIQHKTGYDISGSAGYDFGLVRAEFEVGHKRASINRVIVNGVVIGSPNDLRLDASGHHSVTSAMLNLMLDLGRDDGLNGSVGGGIGWANVHQESHGPLLSARIDDSRSTTAFQLIAGVRYPVSRNIDLGVKYRYFRTRRNLDFEGRLVDTGGPFVISNGRWSSHSLLATVAFNFGSAGTQ